MKKLILGIALIGSLAANATIIKFDFDPAPQIGDKEMVGEVYGTWLNNGDKSKGWGSSDYVDAALGADVKVDFNIAPTILSITLNNGELYTADLVGNFDDAGDLKGTTVSLSNLSLDIDAGLSGADSKALGEFLSDAWGEELFISFDNGSIRTVPEPGTLGLLGLGLLSLGYFARRRKI